MSKEGYRYVYGPVPSRRLGRSLGIDLVPFKTCTYDCIYCQLGATTDKTVLRKEYVPLEGILEELKRKLSEEDRPDYISLAGSGEPTLYGKLGVLIEEIKRITDIPIAAITNGSLLWMDEVRKALFGADLVVPSLDAADETLFNIINRPHKSIEFQTMADGIAEFTAGFKGEVWLEVLLLADLTGTDAEAGKIAAAADRIAPARVQLNTVARPPAEQSARPVSMELLKRFACFFKTPTDIVCSTQPQNPDGRELPDSGESAIVDMLARRPCTSADVSEGLSLNHIVTLKHLDNLLARKKVKTTILDGRTYYTIPDSAGKDDAQ